MQSYGYFASLTSESRISDKPQLLGLARRLLHGSSSLMLPPSSNTSRGLKSAIFSWIRLNATRIPLLLIPCGAERPS